MKKRQLTLAVTAALLSTGMGQSAVHAGHDENLSLYTLDTIVVEAEQTINQFGDTVTEQSYYRTGGSSRVRRSKSGTISISRRRSSASRG